MIPVRRSTCLAMLAAFACAMPRARSSATNADTPEWIRLFNGRDLDDWTVKSTGHATFRAEEGLLKVRYARWDPFKREIAHIFYKRRPFTHYAIAVEYRFVGDKTGDASVMIHAQPPESVALDERVPAFLELALTGRPADQWLRAEALVLGDSLIKHIVGRDTVTLYSKAPIHTITPFTGSYIALKSEAAPIDFRKVELLNLAGCTDPDALTYKRYFLKSDSTACFYAAPRR